MGPSPHFVNRTVAVLGVTALLSLAVGLMTGHDRRGTRSRLAAQGRDTLRAAVCFNPCTPDRLGYAVGLEYALLKKFGEAEDITMEVLLTNPDSSDRWQELEDGLTDILIMDSSDTAADVGSMDARLSLRRGECLWAVRERDRRLLADINRWLSLYMDKSEYARLESRFAKPCLMGCAADTVTGIRQISPYDDLIKTGARTLGWDWRLLAAVVCQESKFLIAVTSAKGAAGLMQVRPVTARHYGMQLSYDPGENVAIGTMHLSHLQELFPTDRYEPSEAVKLTLAAYNCGNARIQECMKYAAGHDLDTTLWSGVADAILMMKKKGVFNGGETLRFVEEILSRYEVYKSVVPE